VTGDLHLDESRLVERVSALGVAYSVRGNGTPIVLLHGWCLNGRLWEIQEEALLSDHTVLCVDLAGFGRSRRLAGPYSIRRHADDVGDLLDELELTDVVVGGFAYGGAVALQLAETNPSRLRRLVVIGIPSGATAPYDRMPRAMRRDWPDFARRSAEAICKQPQSEAKLAMLARMFGDTPLPVALETVGALSEFDPVSLAARVSVLTTFLHGANDDVVPVSVADTCVEAMSGAALVVVPDSGHLVLVDQPEAVTRVLEG
jgi:pimeloyl-ACP methyl ester carboxylesterase